MHLKNWIGHNSTIRIPSLCIIAFELLIDGVRDHKLSELGLPATRQEVQIELNYVIYITYYPQRILPFEDAYELTKLEDELTITKQTRPSKISKLNIY